MLLLAHVHTESVKQVQGRAVFIANYVIVKSLSLLSRKTF